MIQYDEEFVQAWLASPQTSLYYSLQVMQNTQAKDDAMAALDEEFDFTFQEFSDAGECVGCAE